MPEFFEILNSEIWNCENAFQSPCPMRWSELARTGIHGVRHCDVCNENVHLCRTPQEFVDHGNSGKCVAILDRFVPGNLNSGFLGRPSPEAVRRLEANNKDCREWWTQVLESETEFEPDAIDAVRSSI